MSRSQWGLVGLILALALGRVAYALLIRHHLEQTAALFVGLPAILAIVLASTSPARSATGTILKGVTIALLLSGIVLGEGLICIAFAAPLFYLIALSIGLTVDHYRNRKAVYGIVIIPFMIMSAEGVHDRLAFPRDESVTAERVIPVSAAEVERLLGRGPRFEKTLPLGLRLGFPTPIESAGEGLQPGDRRVVRFASGKGHTGDLTLEVAERAPGEVVFRARADLTPIAHWLQWQEAEVRWTELDAGRTLVGWTLRYRRHLDPAWYFAPLERVVVQGAAGYLIDSLATPP